MPVDCENYDPWPGRAVDEDRPDHWDDIEDDRCDQCGQTSGCLLNGLCPMCYETGGGVLHRRMPNAKSEALT